MRVLLFKLMTLLASTQVLAQSATDPFPTPLPERDGVIAVNFVEFASVPDSDGEAARLMLLVNDPGTRRLFVNDMLGQLYSISYDGKTVGRYLDLNVTAWAVSVNSSDFERGFQSFAFHPRSTIAGPPATESSTP